MVRVLPPAKIIKDLIKKKVKNIFRIDQNVLLIRYCANKEYIFQLN